ncbi:deaminase domain-containing protein [Pseudomonas sp. MDT1-17]
MLATNPLATTSYQQHMGQLAEYDALITSLRNAKANTISLPDIFLSPQPHSPLAQEHEIGQTHLQKLLENPDYLDLLRSKAASIRSMYLSVAFSNGNAVYETANIDGKTIILPLTEQSSLQSLAGNIEKAVLNIGGRIRSDRLLSLPQILWYYGLEPEQLQNVGTLDSLIQQLDEMRADYILGLENGMDIGDLIEESDHRPILDAVSLILDDDETSVIESLGKEALVNVAADKLRATPAIFLDRLLSSNKAQWLAEKLLEQLKWYGAQPDEEPDSSIKKRLVAEAIRRWYSLTDDKPDDTIARFRLEQASNWGKSYQTLRSEFELYLIDSGRVTTTREAILLARLLQPQLPTEFQVRDIPQDLPYRSSIVWVNFVHGVVLAEAMEPDSIQRMSFQQLVDFPLQQSMQANQQELELIALCRLPPTLEWAITNGIIAERVDSNYSTEEKAHSIKALDEHTDALKKAIIQMDVNYPERSTIAEREIKRYFKDALRTGHDGKLYSRWGENQSFFAFISDGRKLIEDFGDVDGGGLLQTPPLKDKIYTFQDVYISGGLSKNRNWFITTTDGIRKSEYRISINPDRTIKTDAPWLPATLTQKPLPDIEKLFDTAFNSYLELSKSAYQTLLKSQLTSLPYDDRQAIELGEVKIYTLRKSTSEIELEDETSEMTLPLRLRMGFILQISYKARISYYECLPRSGIIRKRWDFSSAMLNGKIKAQQVKGSFLGNTDVIAVRGEKRVPFDWSAHESGSFPKKNATCDAIIDQLGSTFTAPFPNIERELSARLTDTTSRATELANFIARNFFYYDEKLLHATARGETEMERIAARPHWLESVKGFIPFWGSISDLLSDNPNKGWAVFGLFIDVASFAFPLGKFVSGSMKLVSTSVRSGVRAALPKFGALSQKLLVSTAQNFIPFYGVPTLTLRLARGALSGIYAGVRFTARKSYNSLKPLIGRSGSYSFIEGLPQASNPGRWTPLSHGDQLATLRGIEDVPVRNIASTGTAHYHLIDPLSSKQYGPSLATRSGELSLGRSHYSMRAKNDRHVIVELSENSRIREVLEVDGRTTLFIDDQPYRLKDDVLRRPDLTGADNNYKAIPCRVRRAPGADLCKTSYVIRDPAPTPELGSFVNDKGWAPWFGDIIYTPATGRAAMQVNAIRAHATLEATMEFQKGIYGRVFVSVPVRGKQLVDNFQVGSIIVESMDGSKHYVFMRLNAGDFYVAERGIGQSVHDILTFKKADTLPEALKNELLLVYTGSLNANNMARIYGVGPVERALRTMDEIAIPVGGHVNPPDTLKLLKVDTSPGEAVLFDHSTRMIVRSSTDGAATWSLSKAAPNSVRETTAEIFNHLFQKEVVTLSSSTQGGPKALKIDDTMRQLQRLISKETHRPVHSPRNIAFAEIKTKGGVHEVYVSVSGNQNDTGFLPLFAKNRSANEVKVGNASYFNIDHGIRFPETALEVNPQGKLQAIPHTINDIENYTPALTNRPTSLDTESKLISVIRGKYPDPKELDSITIATTMAPCDSCSVVMKQFGYDGPDALDVIWK